MTFDDVYMQICLSKTYLNVLYNKLYKNKRCKNRVDFRNMYAFSVKESLRISIHIHTIIKLYTCFFQKKMTI